MMRDHASRRVRSTDLPGFGAEEPNDLISNPSGTGRAEQTGDAAAALNAHVWRRRDLRPLSGRARVRVTQSRLFSVCGVVQPLDHLDRLRKQVLARSGRLDIQWLVIVSSGFWPCWLRVKAVLSRVGCANSARMRWEYRVPGS